MDDAQAMREDNCSEYRWSLLDIECKVSESEYAAR